MSPTHPVLAHQSDCVESLSKNFDQVVVLTGHFTAQSQPNNVEVISSEWCSAMRYRSILRFLRLFFGVLNRTRPNIVFSHMTTLQSALMGPFLRFLGIRHVFWYAHTSSTFLLKVAYFFSNVTVTSTVGSFPWKGSKVVPIGQSIDTELFAFTPRTFANRLRCVHVGRLDRSKNIGLIIESVSNCRNDEYPMTLTFIGESSTFHDSQFITFLKEKWKSAIEAGWLTFCDPVLRTELPSILTNFDVFVHGFIGSLDKALLEAVSLGLPVVSINSEYRAEFLFKDAEMQPTLETQLRDFRVRPSGLVRQDVEAGRYIIEKKHSMLGWSSRLSLVLKSHFL